MNIKIKASGVYCLVGEDYDKVYSALKKQFGDGETQIFTERTPGHEYLQWELPGDGWTALSECDPLMSQTVKRELSHRCHEISAKFGANQQMAQKVLSYPDDAYVYYKADSEGHIIIKITAWGYRYPERIGDGPSVGIVDPVAKTEKVTVKLLHNGKPMANKSLKLNGFLRNTGPDGVLEIGDLPTGYQFDIDTGKGHEHVVVMQGQGNIEIDVTEYATVEIHVYSGDAPCADAVVDVQYCSQKCQLVCNDSGFCTVRLPRDPEGGMCVVSVDTQTQQKMLEEPLTTFEFRLAPPKKEEKPEEEEPEQIKTDAPLSGKKQIEVIVRNNGQPSVNTPVEAVYVNDERTLRTDDNGIARTEFAAASDDLYCTVTVGGERQQKALKDSLTVFNFDTTAPVIHDATVEVNATINGEPYSNAPVHIHYKGLEYNFRCDAEGHLSTNIPHNDSNEQCYVSVDSESQSRVLQDGVNHFDFDFKRSEELSRDDDSGKHNYLYGTLLSVLLAALTTATYMVCRGLLFG